MWQNSCSLLHVENGFLNVIVCLLREGSFFKIGRHIGDVAAVMRSAL